MPDIDKSDSSQEMPKGSEVTFGLLTTSLMMDCLVALGEVENPATKKKEPDLAHAKFAIDMLEMLQTKTKNNLTKDEDNLLESILYELHLKFVAKNNPPT